MALGPLEILVVGFPTPAPGPDVADALAGTEMCRIPHDQVEEVEAALAAAADAIGPS